MTVWGRESQPAKHDVCNDVDDSVGKREPARLCTERVNLRMLIMINDDSYHVKRSN